jgi:uncharacterized protein (TIGR03118 family)
MEVRERQNFWRRTALAAIAILFLALTPLQVRAASGYVQHNLASDIPLLADNTDPNLVNPWGLALSPFWICNDGTGTFNIDNADGTPTTVITNVPLAGGKTGPGHCTGAVRNNNPAAFLVSPATATTAAVPGTWLLDTVDGLITIRSGTQNVIKVDNSASGAVYTGIALTNNPDYVYAANFNAGTIDVYDGTWAKATLAGSFKDPSVPAGFAPFNIQLLAGKLYVTYAKQDATKSVDVGGPGNGYVAVFDTNGNLIQHLISTGPLNSPWGVAIAPPSFGTFANALLVGNFRDGKINAFDASSGNVLGTLQDPAGNPIINIGLWALEFGNSTSGNYSTTLYFTAGIPGNSGIQTHGLFGAFTTTAPPAIGTNGIVNGASFATGALAPGSIAAVFGTNLTDNGGSCLPPACNPSFRSDKRLNATLAGAQVQINGVDVPLFYASPIQLGIQIPAELTAGGTATVQVIVDGQSSAASTINLAQFSPGIFAGAITHANGTAVTTASPAAVAETVTIYANGLGQASPAVLTGELPSGIVSTLTTPTVTIDGIAAPPVQFSGLAGCCVGVNQINVVVPTGVRSGTNVPVVVSIGGQQSNTVNMASK